MSGAAFLFDEASQLVLRLVDELVRADPRHHRAQALADLLDRMLVVQPARRLELGEARAILAHPLGGESAGLDILQHFLHLGLCLARNDARTGNVLSEFGGVRDG